MFIPSIAEKASPTTGPKFQVSPQNVRGCETFFWPDIEIQEFAARQAGEGTTDERSIEWPRSGERVVVSSLFPMTRANEEERFYAKASLMCY